ncbi:class I SAM-dependent methyltransferase [Pseudomonas sp. SA3-5]|uniref:Class I SAM-dependent methyltransferase n=1 Tax=Pseudomonas aestuarii TaxID=3018340 RepID=A0ABT4XK48_9PSED|nr:class I SAM-dependent methyltransferase [Pseudomonas aestuarii]MDA7088600.1 class I SAM-dependent methyltransferase [Pseudomonas aestuarii]
MNTPDFDAIKSKQKLMWASGNYAKVGSTLQLSGELLCESMALSAGQTVLDVAAGNGNATLAAARRFCRVTSTDYVQDLLDQSMVRALSEGMEVNYQLADAENLPFADNRYDNVVSTFGVMFAPNQVKAAAELLRVCKPGGRIGLANWTPDSFIGQLFKIIGRYVPPPAGVSSPANWGAESFIEANFAPQAQNIAIQSRDFLFRYLSAEHWLEEFRTYYGPTHKAFNALASEQQVELANEILSLLEKCNVATDGTLIVPSTYLEVVITKKA